MSKFIVPTFIAVQLAIVFSDTIPGLVLRAAFSAPFVWTGIIDTDQATKFADLYNRFSRGM